MKKKGFIIGGICLAAIVGILGYNHEAVRVVFHNVYSPSVKLDDSSKWNGGKAYEKLPYSETSENDSVGIGSAASFADGLYLDEVIITKDRKRPGQYDSGPFVL